MSWCNNDFECIILWLQIWTHNGLIIATNERVKSPIRGLFLYSAICGWHLLKPCTHSFTFPLACCPAFASISTTTFSISLSTPHHPSNYSEPRVLSAVCRLSLCFTWLFCCLARWLLPSESQGTSAHGQHQQQRHHRQRERDNYLPAQLRWSTMTALYSSAVGLLHFITGMALDACCWMACRWCLSEN